MQPLEDFSFDAAVFASHALELTENYETMSCKQELMMLNERKLKKLVDKTAGSHGQQIDPFGLVKDDLEFAKNFAIENILRTRY